MKIMRIKLLITLCLLLLISYGYAQSKKEQIEILEHKIDSLMILYTTEQGIQKAEILALNEQIKNLSETGKTLASKNASLEDMLHHTESETQACLAREQSMKFEVDNLNKRLNEKPLCFFDAEYSVSSYYAFKLLENEPGGGLERYFELNSKEIIRKEKKRIEQSTRAKRNGNVLTITTNSGSILLENNSDHDGMGQTFYSFLFEDLDKNKAYYARIQLMYAGGGSENSELIEIDFITGNTHTHTPEYMGGEFYFNSKLNLAVITGWHVDGGDYLLANKIALVNLSSRKTELTIPNSEIMNLTWLSEASFKCQLIKYEANDEGSEPYFNRPINYQTPFTVFTHQNEQWILKEE
jgi:hypothetical protein